MSGGVGENLNRLREWGAALTDELAYLLNNLDSGNVRSAASVKAENIDTSTARISNAQVGVLNADKLTAGTINTNHVSISDEQGCLNITGSAFELTDASGEPLLYAGYDSEADRFDFHLYGKNGKGIYLNNEGNAVFSGMLSSSEIYSSKIIGTLLSEFLQPTVQQPFVQIDRAGIKLNQSDPSAGRHIQKLGATISDAGNVILVLGEGEGDISFSCNGVIYREGSFLLTKNTDDTAVLELYNQNSKMIFKNGGITFQAGSVKIGEEEVATLADLQALQNQVNSLQTKLRQKGGSADE